MQTQPGFNAEVKHVPQKKKKNINGESQHWHSRSSFTQVIW